MRAALVLTFALATGDEGQASGEPATVVVNNGTFTLRALLWRPRGHGPFPAVLFNHGSGRSRAELERLGPYERQADALGPGFTRQRLLNRRRERAGRRAEAAREAAPPPDTSSRPSDRG